MAFNNCSFDPSHKIGSTSLSSSNPLSFNRTFAQQTVQQDSDLTGDCLNGATLNFTVQDSIAPADQICVGGKFLVHISLAGSDGPKVVTVKQNSRDRQWADSITITKDSTPPQFVISNVVLNQGQIILSASCEDRATISIEGDVTASNSSACTAGNFQTNLMLTAGDGLKSIVVKQTDSAGNTSSNSTTYLVDTTAPRLTISSPLNNAVVKNAINVSGECESGLDITISGTGAQAPVSQRCANSSYTIPVQITNGDGAKILSVAQRDLSGNATTLNLNLVQVTFGPAVTVVNPKANLVTGSSVAVNGACVSGLNVTIGGQLTAPLTVACSAGAFSANVTLASGDGSKQITVTQTDAVGNATTVNTIVTLDTLAPVLTVARPTMNSFATATLISSGTCETGLPVSISGNGLAAAAQVSCVAGQFSTTLTLSAGDGSKTLAFAQTDAANNSASISRVFTKDTVLPAVSFTAPLNNSTTMTNSVPVSGSCETGLNVKINGAGVAAELNLPCANSAFSGTATLVSGSGNRVLTASQTDLAGNVGSGSTTVMSVAPTSAVVIKGPIAGLATKGAITLQGTCQNGTAISVSGQIAAQASATCTNGTFTQNVTLSGADGSKTVSVSQVLPTGTATDSRSFTLDTTAPALTIAAPVAGTAAQSSLSLSGACESGLAVSITGAVSAASTATCTAGGFSSNITFSAGDGTKAISVSQTDSAGNVATVSRSFLRKNTGPNLTIATPAANSVAKTSVTIAGTCEGTNAIQITGSGAIATSASCTSSAFSIAVNLSSGDGAKVISLSQSDTIGNVTTVSRSFVKDSTAPILTFTSPASGTVAKTSVNISGTCEANGTIQIFGAGVSAASTTTCANSLFSATATLSSGDGAKTISISQTDAAGNLGSAALNVVRDNTAPITTVVTPAPNVLTKANLQISGACETGLTVSFSGTNVTVTTAVCSAGAYTKLVTLTGADGAKSISVGQTDAAGNSSNVTLNVMLDTLAPVLTILSPEPGSMASAGLTITGACESGFNVTANGSGIASSVSKLCAASAYSLDVVFSSGDGNKTVTVSQADAAGNSTSVSRDFVRGSPLLFGQALYDSKCATCHGNFASSNLVGRSTVTLAGITTAMATKIPSMKFLDGTMSSAQISSIEALFPTSGMGNPMVSNFICTSTEAEKQNSSELIRLKGDELRNSYMANLSSSVWNSLASQTFLIPADTLGGTISNFNGSYNADTIERISRFNEQVAIQIGSSDANIKAFFGNCASATSFVKATCFDPFLASKGPIILRSPLTADDNATIWARVSLATAVPDQLSTLVQILFNDPRFLYHLELGEGTADINGMISLTSHEIANRIAYGMTASPPDSALRTDAGLNNLKNLTTVAAHVDRISQLPAFKSRVIDFVKYYIGLSEPGAPPTHVEFLNGVNTAGLEAAVTDELNEFINYIVFTSNGTLSDMFTSRAAFPKTSTLAGIMGTSVWTSGAPMTATNHPGILSKPFLQLVANPNLKLVQRGKRIRINMLCSDVPQPSATDLAARPTLPSSDLVTLNRRSYIDKATNNLPGASGSCFACHSKMNQLGFATENYDSIGRFSATERIYDTNDVKVATFPAPSSSTPNITDNDSRTFADLLQLETALATSDTLHQCISRKAYQFFQRKQEITAYDSCRLNKLDTQIKKNLPLLGFFTENFKQQSILYKRSN